MRRKRLILALVAALAAVLSSVLIPSSVSASNGATSQGAGAKPATVSIPVAPPSAAGPAPECLGFSANSPQTRVKTDDIARASSSTAWTTLPCGFTTVNVPRGRTALIVTHVDAEVSCQGPSGQWCQGRVLVGNTEGEPNAPEPDSQAWATARSDINQWESNAFSRTLRVTCSSTSPSRTCVIPVRTQVRNHAAGMTFRVDDLHMHVQANF